MVVVIRSCRCGEVRLRRWVWGGGCEEERLRRWVWGGGCGVVSVGVGMENPTPVQNFTYLEPNSIISSLFVQSVIFCHSLCGLLNKSEGVGECVCVWL